MYQSSISDWKSGCPGVPNWTVEVGINEPINWAVKLSLCVIKCAWSFVWPSNQACGLLKWPVCLYIWCREDQAMLFFSFNIDLDRERKVNFLFRDARSWTWLCVIFPLIFPRAKAVLCSVTVHIQWLVKRLLWSETYIVRERVTTVTSRWFTLAGLEKW